MTIETRRQLHQHKKLTQRKVAKPQSLVRRQSSSSTIDNTANCLAGGLYVAPTTGQQISVINATDIKWNQACLDGSTSKIDIYVYSPSEQDQALPIHVFQGIPSSQALYSTKLDPRWWGRDLKSNSTVDVSFNIVPSGNEPWDSSNPMGPTFTANYVVPETGETEASQIFGKLTNSVKTAFFEAGKLTAAGKTAAIVCPLVVLAVGLGMLIRRLHIKRHNKTVDWADTMDKRMSRISVDWTQGGDGSAGPLPGTRPASYVHRPSRDMDAFGNFAGRGAMARVPRQMDDITPVYASENEMREAMPRGMSIYDEGNRTSRISFAGNTRGDRVSRISYANSTEGQGRPSINQSRLGGSQPRSQVDSYYDPDAPAVPHLDDRFRTSHDQRRNSQFSDGLVYAGPDEMRNPEDNDDILMSPTQNDGPRPLGFGDVDRMRDSLNAGQVDYPASSVVQTGRQSSDGQDMFAGMTNTNRHSDASQDSYIDHEHYQNTGNGMSNQTGMAPPSNFSSPDEAMKNYASLRAAAGTGSSQAPQLTLQPSSSQFQGMRSLYTPDASAAHGYNAHTSVAGSSLNEEEVVGYNEMIDHGNQSH